MSKFNNMTDKLLFESNGNLSSFFNKSDNESILFTGNTLNLQLSQNSEKDIDDAILNNLSIVDYIECENILKKNNVLNENDYLQVLNTNVKLNVKNNQSARDSLYTNLVNSKGRKIDTSLCNDFEIKLPTRGILPNQEEYYLLKEQMGADIYNKSDTFFNDICFSYKGKNNTDITLSQRKETFSTTYTCSTGCNYNGINNLGYYACKCPNLSNNRSYSFIADNVFDLFTNSNIELAGCYMNIFRLKFTENYGLLFFIVLTNFWLVVLTLQSYIYGVFNILNNFPKVIFNDSTDFSSRLLNNNNNILNNDGLNLQPQNVGGINIFNFLKSKKTNLDSNMYNSSNSNNNNNNINNFNNNNNNINNINNFNNNNIGNYNNNNLASKVKDKDKSKFYKISNDNKVDSERIKIFSEKNSSNNSSKNSSLVYNSLKSSDPFKSDAVIFNNLVVKELNNRISQNIKNLKRESSNNPVKIEVNIDNLSVNNIYNNYDNNKYIDNNIISDYNINDISSEISNVPNNNYKKKIVKLNEDNINRKNSLKNNKVKKNSSKVLTLRDNSTIHTNFNTTKKHIDPMSSFKNTMYSNNFVELSNSVCKMKLYDNNNNNNNNDKSKNIYNNNNNDIYTLDIKSHKNSMFANIDYIKSEKIHAYTFAEISKLPIEKQLKIENRTIFTSYWIEIKRTHEIINLFFYYSIVNPISIRITMAFFSISIKLCSSALFFSDQYIKQLAKIKVEKGEEAESVWYTLSNQFWRIFWPMFISIIMKNLINLIIIIPKPLINELNEYLVSQKKSVIKQGL